MDMTIPQAKRIKLEHSYAHITDGEPITTKEEDPLEFEDTVETIKIEIDEDNLIKIEPADDSSDQVGNFEYLNVANEIDASSAKVQSTNSELECPTNVDNAVNTSSDPLRIVKYEYVEPDKLLLEDEQASKKTNSKNYNVSHEGSKGKEPGLLSVLEKDDALRRQISKLKADLKAAKSREKALQTELGARRMSEIFLEEKNSELKEKLQVCSRKEKANTKLMKDLAQKLVLTQKENTLRTENTERVRREYADKLDKLRAQLKKKELEHKHLDLKCGSLTHDIARLTARLDIQKIELEQAKHKSISTDKLLKENARVLHTSNQRVMELTKVVASAQRDNDELQKSLLAEKKMSRYFVRERDQLLEQQEARFMEAEKELGKLKLSVATLSSALTQKIIECKAQKGAAKKALTAYQKKSQELASRTEELQKKQLEMENKTCEYCGF